MLEHLFHVRTQDTPAVSGKQVEFTEPGTVVEWTVPEGVTSICILAVGSSRGRRILTGTGYGPPAGGVSYSNNKAVTPGEVLTIELAGPQFHPLKSTQVLRGTDVLCKADSPADENSKTGGTGGLNASYSNSGGTSGGNGARGEYNKRNYGGGGAASYGDSVSKLEGAILYSNKPSNNATPYWGGGSGGGGDNPEGTNGGGIGLKGPDGTTALGVLAGDGNPGSGGVGAMYGGGITDGTIGNSAVRIIWGEGREYPRTNTEDQF